jgi:parallel beta-helix repeat protein
MNYTFKLSRRLATAWLTIVVVGATVSACTQDLQENSDPTAEPADLSIADAAAPPKRVVAEIGQTISLTRRSGSWQVRDVANSPVSDAVVWTASGGNITASGDFSASTTGDYTVVLKRRGRKKADTTVVVVVPPPSNPVAITLTPDTTTLPTGSSQSFQAKAVLGDSSQTNIGVTWRATGGTIDAGGNYVAGRVPGHYVAIAKSVSYSLEDSALIVIDSTPSAPPPSTATLSAVRLSPDSTALFTGATQQFTAIGVLSDASTAPVPVTFSATGGTIDSTGLYRAGPAAGIFRVIATAGSFADTSRVAISIAQTGTTIYPGQSIQAAVDAFPAGTSFLLKAGVHRQQSVTPKANDVFRGETGAVLDGGRMLTGFTSDGSGRWYVDGQTQQGAVSTSTCQPGHPGCVYPEQLWIDGTLIEHQTSLGAVSASAWYFDYAADRIYIGTNPSGHTVVTSVTPFAFGGTATGVRIVGLTIQHYAPARPQGAVNASAAASWTMDTNIVQDNATRGIRLGAGGIMRGNSVLRNGQLGYQANGSNGLIYGNEFAFNNTAYFGPGMNGEAGAGKASSTNGLVFRKNNLHDNHGPGIWFDINNQNATIDSNTVTNNDWRGIFYEVSYSGHIAYNTVTGNGFAFPGTYGAGEGAGILVSNSPNVEVDHNTVSGNKNGIMGREDDRGSGCCGILNVTNLSVHDNVVKQMDAGRAAGITNSDPAADPYSTAANNRWFRNSYTVGSSAKWRWEGNLDVTMSQWKAVQDSGSTFQ